MNVLYQPGTILVITENGYGKRTTLSQFKVQNRGGIGIKTAKVTSKNGGIVDAKIVNGKDSLDLIAISAHGQVIRVSVDTIRSMGRDTQGVIVMRLKKGDKIASLTLLSDLGAEVERQRGEHDS
jgi:DNA gyrase subunit A